MVKQVGLLTAGCQPWNNDVCAASSTGDRFAYCATLAIYVYQRDVQYREFKLHAIMSEHKKTVTAICWCPRNADLFASASADNQKMSICRQRKDFLFKFSTGMTDSVIETVNPVVIVWDVNTQQVAGKLDNTKGIPVSVDWCLHEPDTVAFIHGRGPLCLWKYNSGSVSGVKESQGLMSDICQFRWHPKKVRKAVCGHKDGSISLINMGQKSYKHLFRPESVEGTDDDDPVIGLDWDPLSKDYLLIANSKNPVRLLDIEHMSVIMTFQLPSLASQVRCLSWICNAPGMFLTGDMHSGILRIWNVSKSSPIENIKIKKTGFHALFVIPDSQNSRPVENGHSNKSAEHYSHTSSTSEAVEPFISPLLKFALPPAFIVATFLDGGVGLYNLGRRKWCFLRDQGHVETIFDCQFKPDSPDLLATSSFDGTVKVWDINTLQAIESSPGNEGVIYSVSWAPADLNCIVAGTSKQGIFLWDIGKGKITRRYHEHGKASVYSVSWSKKDSRRIMSCGADSYCVVRQVDGTLIQRYKHPASVFGCDWSPHNKDMLATGCEDTYVRVFYLATSSDQPLKVFTGHSCKVFHVRWSPLREGILCSGSDDGSIRVWEYTQEACVNVLNGHKGPIRGLLWSTELPYLLISGSWDYSIRFWDTRDGACLDVVFDHGADVYGLTCHPQQPFLLASCSRDSTVRLWSLVSLIQPLQLHLIAGSPATHMFSSIDHAMAAGASPLLAGKASKELREMVNKLQGDKRARSLRLFSKFFSSPTGTANLWELVAILQGLDNSLLSPEYAHGIKHVKHLTKFEGAKAQELELVKMVQFGGGIGAPSKEECVRDAAKIHIKLGNVQRYCELMVELGEWEKALAISPGVSFSYWKSLADRYSSFLMRHDSDDAVPYCIATGNTETLTSYYTGRGQLSDALLTTQVACEGTLDHPQYVTESKHSENQCNGYQEPGNRGYSRLLLEAVRGLANWHFRNGSPTLAACCHLSVDDPQRAMSVLIRGNELEMAAAMGTVLNSCPRLTHLALEYLSYRCEHLGFWELAIEMLQSLSDSKLQLAKLCARCAASMDEINFYHDKAGYPNMETCLSDAETLKENGEIFESVKFYLLSTAQDIGLDLGLQHVKDEMLTMHWKVSDVFDLLQLLGAIRSDKLQKHKNEGMKAQLLCLSSYLGALMAIQRGYDVIVPSLFDHAISILDKEQPELPVSRTDLHHELKAWTTVREVQKAGDNPVTVISPELYAIYKTVAYKSETSQEMEPALPSSGADSGVSSNTELDIDGFLPLEKGPDCVASSHLPSHSDVHMSCLTGLRIQGPAYFLEDGKSAISMNEALMWAKVNPFSPLGSGVRLNPF